MELHPLKIRFYPKLKSPNSDIYTLYMRMILSGNRTDISLGYDLAKKAWEEKAQALKIKHHDRSYVVNLTNQFRHKLQEIFQQLIQRNMDCYVNIIRKMLVGDKVESNSFMRTVPSLFDRTINKKEALADQIILNHSKPRI